MAKTHSPTALTESVISFSTTNKPPAIEQAVRAPQYRDEFKNFLENHVRKLIPYDLAFLGIAAHHIETQSRQARNFHTGFMQLILSDKTESDTHTDNRTVLYVDIEKGIRLHPIKQIVTRQSPSDPAPFQEGEKKYELFRLQLLTEKNRFNNQLYGEFILMKTHSPVTELNKHSANRLAPLLKEKLLELLHQETLIQSRVHTLTLREKEILSCINQGFSNKQIGCKLAISEFTVKNHVRRIQKKLNADNRAHALAIALSEGLTLDDCY